MRSGIGAGARQEIYFILYRKFMDAVPLHGQNVLSVMYLYPGKMRSLNLSVPRSNTILQKDVLLRFSGSLQFYL